jgi:hypothetical protein
MVNDRGRAHWPGPLLELGLEACAAAHWPAAAADAALAAFAMGDEHGRREACFDCRDRVADVDHERAAADGCAIDVGGRNAKVEGGLGGAGARASDAVDIGGLQARVLHGSDCRLGVQPELRVLREDAFEG